MADEHALAALKAKSADEIDSHKDAERQHRTAAKHYHNASGAFRRGVGQEATDHLRLAQAHGDNAMQTTQDLSGGG
jgi:hypothetical protein